MSCTTSQNEIFVTEKHDLYQTLMRLLLINSRCRSAISHKTLGYLDFNSLKAKIESTFYPSVLMYTSSCFLIVQPSYLHKCTYNVHFFTYRWHVKKKFKKKKIAQDLWNIQNVPRGHILKRIIYDWIASHWIYIISRLKKRFGEVGFNLSSKDVLKARGQKRIVTAMSGNGVCRFNFPACCYKNFLAIYLYTFHNFHKWISNIYALYLM